MVAYKEASTVAEQELQPIHPIRLGLALNLSIFHYDTFTDHERAHQIAKQAVDDSTAEVNTLSEESYKESTVIIQLLRDTLALWESAMQGPGKCLLLSSLPLYDRSLLCIMFYMEVCGRKLVPQ